MERWMAVCGWPKRSGRRTVGGLDDTTTGVGQRAASRARRCAAARLDGASAGVDVARLKTTMLLQAGRWLTSLGAQMERKDSGRGIGEKMYDQSWKKGAREATVAVAANQRGGAVTRRGAIGRLR
ncbi:MOSC domain-containing protein [Sesbania bispinosa]|nr:MOSC domain-containing protein [Sesbania bispinosa]